VKDSAAHRASMTTTASYLEQTSGKERDPFDWAPEFSRRARGFTVYAALRTLGRTGVESLIDRACAAARTMAGVLRSDPRVEVLNDVDLNQVLVRFHPAAGGNVDEFTRSVITRIQQDGTMWAAGTTWHGMAALRISVSNWATDEAEARRSAESILRVL
jgi:glutamate/tyrosine decarboxylase-like PLP-dependent enzyme